MKHYKVLVSRRSHQDLQAILAYMIHELKAPAAAASFLDEVETVVRGLEVMPERFELLRDEPLRQAGYRSCQIKNYLLFYKVIEQKKTVQLYRLIYARRNWKDLL